MSGKVNWFSKDADAAVNENFVDHRVHLTLTSCKLICLSLLLVHIKLVRTVGACLRGREREKEENLYSIMKLQNGKIKS